MNSNHGCAKYISVKKIRKQEQKMERPDMAGKCKKPGKDQILIGILVGVLLLVIALPQNSDSQKEPAGAAEIPM